MGKSFGEYSFEKQWPFKPTRTLYDEWHKYMLTQEQQAVTEHAQQVRAARDAGVTEPDFEDPFTAYARAVQQVLPHLRFRGVDTKERTLRFDSAGTSLPFHALSGGEREIAFLLGQMDRFRLRSGLMTLDEPELHLNPALLRRWVQYLSPPLHAAGVRFPQLVP